MKQKTWFSWASVAVIIVTIMALALNSQNVGAQAAIPAGSVVTSAILSLHDPNNSNQPVRVHRITSAWDELTVTWASFANAYDPTVSATMPATVNGWNSVDVTSLVQGWVNGQTNNGLLLEEDLTGVDFYDSSEASSLANRPKLDICYTAPGAANTCITIQRTGSAHIDVVDTYISSVLVNENNGNSVTLYSGFIANNAKKALLRFDIPVITIPTPGISIIKYTNGAIASDPNGLDVPQLKPNDSVTWTYEVKNTGNVSFAKADVVVTDDQTGVTPTYDSEISGNKDGNLDPGEVWLFKATGIAADLSVSSQTIKLTANGCTLNGQYPGHNAYVNTGTVTVPGATANAKSSYCNAPEISIVKRTNGHIANDPNGGDVPLLKPGDTLTWTYEITNIGKVPVFKKDVVVTDDQTGVTPVYDSEISGNKDGNLDPGEVWLFKATGIAADLSVPSQTIKLTANGCTLNGQYPGHNAYVNTGTVTVPGATANAKSSYCNSPDIAIVKRTNGHIANDPNGGDVPLLKPGDTLTWTYEVTNIGKVPVFKKDVVVTDDQTGVTPVYDSEISGNKDGNLDPGEVWLFKATGIAADLSVPSQTIKLTANGCTLNGQYPGHNAYVNTGKVVVPGATATAKSSYCNAPDIAIVKRTNGILVTDINSADVPLLKPGDPVTWTYEVSNIGKVPVFKADVKLTDDQTGVTPTYDSVVSGNADNILDPGEVWLYKATGIVADLSVVSETIKLTPNSCTLNGQLPPHNAYVNTGTVAIPGATAKATSGYCNAPDVSIVKRTNGVIANDPNGPDVPVLKPGDPITWTYTVTNVGKVPVRAGDVKVTDNQSGIVPLFDSYLVGNNDNTLDPGEVWVYKATGTAIDLSNAPADVKVVNGVCTYQQTQFPRNGYVNIGTVTIPGVTHPAQSSYCNPGGKLYKLYMPGVANPVKDVIVTKWQMGLGYEDLPLQSGLNDFDYNDWVVDVNGNLTYESATTNLLKAFTMQFSPHARGAAYDHRFHILFPANTFKSNGTAKLTTYDQNHVVIGVQTIPFVASQSTDFVIFNHTVDVFPDNISNTIESKPFAKPQRYVDLVISFTTSFPFTITQADLGKEHGTGLFYDPFLDVLNTGDQVHIGDVRLLSVPSTDWLWPEERVRIDKVYPDVVYLPGPPEDFQFPAFWWTNFNHCVYDGVLCGTK